MLFLHVRHRPVDALSPSTGPHHFHTQTASGSLGLTGPLRPITCWALDTGEWPQRRAWGRLSHRPSLLQPWMLNASTVAASLTSHEGLPGPLWSLGDACQVFTFVLSLCPFPHTLRLCSGVASGLLSREFSLGRS